MNKLVPFYLLSILLFVLFSYFFVDPNFFYLRGIYTGLAFTNRQTVTIVYSLFLLVFFAFYFFFLRKNYISRFLIGVIVLFSLFSYSAMLSSDIFNYLTTAKVLFKYHENPYIVMPIEFAGDSNLLFTHAANKIALYGPFWILLSGIPFFLGFGNFILILFNLKLMVVLFYIGTLFLIKKLSNNFSVTLFALNPLIIIETLIGNHNDIIMMFLALLSFFYLKKRKIVLAILFLISSILIKYATIFLIPVFLLTANQVRKKEHVNWDKVFLYSAISMLLVFLLSALRVEIYPWYAVWFLSFAFLVPKKRILFYISLAFSFGLLFRYVPFMVWGTHFGLTPLVKSLVTFIPVALVLVYVYLKKLYR